MGQEGGRRLVLHWQESWCPLPWGEGAVPEQWQQNSWLLCGEAHRKCRLPSLTPTLFPRRGGLSPHADRGVQGWESGGGEGTHMYSFSQSANKWTSNHIHDVMSDVMKKNAADKRVGGGLFQVCGEEHINRDLHELKEWEDIWGKNVSAYLLLDYRCAIALWMRDNYSHCYGWRNLYGSQSCHVAMLLPTDLVNLWTWHLNTFVLEFLLKFLAKLVSKVISRSLHLYRIV